MGPIGFPFGKGFEAIPPGRGPKQWMLDKFSNVRRGDARWNHLRVQPCKCVAQFDALAIQAETHVIRLGGQQAILLNVFQARQHKMQGEFQ